MEQKKKCHKCNKKIEDNCVCAWYITKIFEEGDVYECPFCFLKEQEEELEKEKYLTKHLTQMIKGTVYFTPKREDFS